MPETNTAAAAEEDAAAAELGTAAYGAVMDSLGAVARSVAGLPLDKVLLTIDRAHALGPVLFPTIYREGADNLRDQRELVEAFMCVQAAVERIRERTS